MPTSPKRQRNSQLKGIFREIFVSSKEELAPFGTAFVFPPENFEQKKLGTLFGIIKISDTSPESSFIVNLLASVIKKEFFSRTDRPPYDSFEASLRKANLALAELARQGSIKWIGRISFAGGVMEKNNLHFSKLGSSAILLLRAGMIADIGSGLGENTEEADSHPLKTFSDISSGRLEKNDRLIFTTSDLLEIFSLEEIRQNAIRFPNEDFSDVLFASLKTNSELSGAIVARLIPEEEDMPVLEKSAFAGADALKFKKASADRKEIQELHAFPQKQAVTPPEPPPGIVSPPKIFSGAGFPPSRPYTPPPAREKNLYVTESDDIIPKKSFLKIIIASAEQISDQVQASAKNILKRAYFSLGKINWQKFAGAAKLSLVRFSQFVGRIISLARKNRYLAAAGLIIVLIAISVSIFFIANRRNSAPPVEIPAPQNETQSSIAGDINARQVENISQVAPVPADGRKLLQIDEGIFLLTEDKSVLQINPLNGEVEKIFSNIGTGKFQLTAAMPDLNSIFIFTEDKKVLSFTPANKRFQENNISLPDNLNAVDLKTYLTYVYFLDPSANQIYRYPRAEGGFGERQNWLKSGTDIKNATGFAINDDLFVASRNQITAYLQGEKDEKINFESPETSLVVDKVFTAPGFENIYALDNRNHRVVQYSKDGKIVAQYFTETISGMKDFTVDEKNKTIYLLGNNQISKFSVQQGE